MTAEHDPFDELAAMVRAMMAQGSDLLVPSLERFAGIQQQRATRLAGAEARLKAALGEDDSRVIALHTAAAATDTLSRALHTMAVREERIPKLQSHQWLVFGQVLDSAAQPVAGVQVRVFDRDRKYDDLLEVATTDEFGDFAVIYHQRDFAEVRENLPDLYVMVTDNQENILFSSRDNVRYEAGRAEYFEIVL